MERKSPWIMRGARDADSRIGHNISRRIRAGDKAVARISAEIHLVISSGNGERLRQFARPGAKLVNVVNPAAFLHQFDPPPRFKCPNQNETIRVAFHQHVQHPMHAIVKIDVGRAGLVALDKAARAWSRKRVRGFIIDCRIRFYLDDYPGALAPNQFFPDEVARTRKRIAFEERNANNSAHRLCLVRSLRENLSRWLVVDRNLYVAFNRLAVAERRDEFRASEIGQRRIAETEQRWFLRQNMDTL